MKTLLAPLLIIAFAIVLRLLPHPPNMAPIAAMALFGGVYLNKKYALLVPLVALFLSDIFLGFYHSMPYVYGSFILTGCIGLWLKHHKSIKNVFLGTIVSSTLFFLITNFGFWLSHSLYPKTIAGQMEAYTMALPFFRNTLIGDFIYVGLFFGAYELMRYFLFSARFSHSKSK